jgi:site-specific DNA-adenine methylase
MWSYYGAKTNLVDLYPKPMHDKIIEPFAGSARYALKYFDREILLVDKYEVIVKIWKWLQHCSEKDILAMPRVKYGETLNDYTFDCEAAKLFMGFIIGCGANLPRIKPTDRKTIDRPNHINYNLKRVAANVWKIKEWKIIHGTYEDIPNETATWFIDPPYQHGGQSYKESSKRIDFKQLAEWCKSRNGQTIVCENTKADWMDFKPIQKQRGTLKTTVEAVWCNYKTAFDNRQIEIFSHDPNQTR